MTSKDFKTVKIVGQERQVLSRRLGGQEFWKEWRRPNDKEFFDTLARPVVLANGAFDLLHSAHLYLLHCARREAGTGSVVVALDSDEKVRRAKGPARPVLNSVQRTLALFYAPVDCVVEIGSDTDFDILVRYLRPDLRVLGKEYARRGTRVPHVPTLFIPRFGKMSTTEIIRRAQEAD